MNTDMLKDISRCHAVLDEFIIDHYDNLLKIVDTVKDDGGKNTHIEDLIEAFLAVGYDSGMQEMDKRRSCSDEWKVIE